MKLCAGGSGASTCHGRCADRSDCSHPGQAGFDRPSTNRIAEQAGVSIGSLYQYYPGKEALAAAVIERHNTAIMQVVGDALAEVAALPVEPAVRQVIAVAIQAHRIDPRLHRVLAEQLPRSGRLAKLEAFHRQTYHLFRAYLADHRHEIRAVDPQLAGFVCLTSIEALTHNAVLHHAEYLAEAAIDTLVEEATRLVVGYLR